MVAVDWERLLAALKWFEAQGYKRMDMPWHASLKAIGSTLGDLDRAWELDGVGWLVGSAEQSFVEALLNGTLEQGKYVSLTPCFRREPVFDATHHPYFMKVELFDTSVEDGRDLEIALEVKKFLEDASDMPVELVKTDEGYDLEVNGIEVGSYSSREFNGVAWTCGTGLAEPRFSYAIAHDKNQSS